MNKDDDQMEGRLQKLGKKTSWINGVAFVLLVIAFLMFIGGTKSKPTKTSMIILSPIVLTA